MSTKKSSTNRSSQPTKRTSASAKSAARPATSSDKKRSPSNAAGTMDKEDMSLLRLFFLSRGGRLITLIALLVLMTVATLLLTGDDPQMFFRVTGIEILLLWGILVIFSLVRRRNNG